MHNRYHVKLQKALVHDSAYLRQVNFYRIVIYI